MNQENNFSDPNSTNMNMADVKYQDEPIVNKSQWKDILQKNDIARELDIKTVLVVYNSLQYKSTATNIAEILDERDYHIISSANVSFSRRICKYLNIKPPLNSDGGNRWWTIPYCGSPTGDGGYQCNNGISSQTAKGKFAMIIINTCLCGNNHKGRCLIKNYFYKIWRSLDIIHVPS